MTKDVLIIDDEADIRLLISGILEDEGYETRQAANSQQALAAIDERCPSLIILDIWMEKSALDGMQLLEKLKRDIPQLPVIMISGHGNIETAVGAIKKGAYDFIEKPFKADRLMVLVERAVEAAQLKRENEQLKIKTGEEELSLLGNSAAVRKLKQSITRVAPTNSRVMISGPPGAGKEIVARMLHKESLRGEGPFVALNCAIMTPERLESELFGEETPEGGIRPGTFEMAHGGTLLLDEVADMPLETQGKIVRVLQEQSFRRVGGSTQVKVDVRVISSTNRDLTSEITAGNFREDLFYRLSVVPITVDALTKRREDVPDLSRYFMRQAARTYGVAERELSDDTMAALQAYEWPGNVRQLRNVMDWLLIMAPGDSAEQVRPDMLPPEIGNAAPTVLKWDKSGEIMGLPLREARETFEREYLTAQVTRFGGNISRTANFVGMERSALHRKLKMLGVHNDRQAKQDNEPDDEVPAVQAAAE